MSFPTDVAYCEFTQPSTVPATGNYDITFGEDRRVASLTIVLYLFCINTTPEWCVGSWEVLSSGASEDGSGREGALNSRHVGTGSRGRRGRVARYKIQREIVRKGQRKRFLCEAAQGRPPDF